jgi:hypothetical protein
VPVEQDPSLIPDSLEKLQAAADSAAAEGRTLEEAVSSPPEGEDQSGGEETPQAEGPVGEEQVTPEPEGQPAEETSGGEEDHQALVKQFDEIWGHKASDKFKSDYDFLASVDQLMRRIGERDEDALVGRKYRDKQAEIDAFLTGNVQQPAPEKPKAEAPPDFDPTWQYQIHRDENGDLKPAPGAPSDIVEKYQAYTKFKESRINELVQDPEAFISKYLDKKAEELEKRQVELTQGQLAAEREQTAVNTWLDTHKNLLYVGGDPQKGESSEAAKILEIYDDLEAKGMSNALDRLEYARQIVESGLPPKNKTLEATKTSIRQPAVSPPPVDEKTPEQMIEEGVPLSEVLEHEWKQMQKAQS